MSKLPLFGNNMNNLCVLLIDDNPNFLYAIGHLLQQQNNIQAVGTAYWGEEGLTKALSLRPDIILMGLFLPDIDGIELVRRLRLCLPETKIIVMALTDSHYYRIAAHNAGANDFVLKHTLNSNFALIRD